MLRLRFEIEGEERTVPLSGSLVRVGRGADNDVVLPDVSVSRHHAELRREVGGAAAAGAAGDRDGWSVVDLKSTNGVEVNRVAVRSAPLHDGDRLRIGVFELRVEAVAPAARSLEATAPAPAPAPLAAVPAIPAIPAPAGTTAASPAPDLAAFNATIIRPLADFTATYGLAGGPPAARPAAGAASARPSPGADDGEARRLLGFLTRLGRVLIRAESVEEVLGSLLDIAFEALPVERGFILLQDETEELVPELARFKDRLELRPAEVPVSRTMLQAVMRERVALVTYDALSDGRLSGGESIRLHQIRAAMCAPLWSGESIIGVVQLDSPFKVGAFDERDLDFLTALANYGAVAVERIRYARRAEFDRQVRSRLERYHSPALIEEVLHEGAEGGIRRPRTAEASVLFADLSGFTAFAESASPEATAELLGAYLSLAVEAIFAAGGTLDKFIGDCVMAFFGAPVPQPDHAQRAVRAAVEIQRGLAALSAGRQEQGLPPLSCRVGINSGPVVVGDVGSSRRVDYTVLGDTVNVAARLEAFVARPGDVVVGPETHRLLDGAFAAEPLGEQQLKGLQRKVAAFRIALPEGDLYERPAQ